MDEFHDLVGIRRTPYLIEGSRQCIDTKLTKELIS